MLGQTAIVTGGKTKGNIGDAIVRALVLEGVRTVVFDYNLDQEPPEDPVEGVVYLECDVSDHGMVKEAVDMTATKFGGTLDHLIISAAASKRKPLLEIEVADFQRTLDVTLSGAFYTAREAARHMLRCNSGTITFIGSAHAYPHRASPGCGDYNAAKAGLYGVFATLATELALTDIRVNVVEPGWTDTPAERAKYPDLDEQAKRLPRGLVQASDIAEMVMFLCGHRSRQFHGRIYGVDGGYCMLPWHDLAARTDAK